MTEEKLLSGSGMEETTRVLSMEEIYELNKRAYETCAWEIASETEES